MYFMRKSAPDYKKKKVDSLVVGGFGFRDTYNTNLENHNNFNNNSWGYNNESSYENS